LSERIFVVPRELLDRGTGLASHGSDHPARFQALYMLP
jgi:hypothetical protein